MFTEPCWDASQWSTNKKEERIIRLNVAIEMIEKIYSDLCRENTKNISRNEIYEFSYLIFQLKTFTDILKDRQSDNITLNDEKLALLPEELKEKIKNSYNEIQNLNKDNYDIIEKINLLRKQFNDNYEKKHELNKEIGSCISTHQKKLLP